MLKINPDELTTVAEFVNRLTGIVLDQSKAYLIESRLGPLADEFGCKNYLELINKAKGSYYQDQGQGSKTLGREACFASKEK